MLHSIDFTPPPAIVQEVSPSKVGMTTGEMEAYRGLMARLMIQGLDAGHENEPVRDKLTNRFKAITGKIREDTYKLVGDKELIDGTFDPVFTMSSLNDFCDNPDLTYDQKSDCLVVRILWTALEYTMDDIKAADLNGEWTK